MFYSEERSSDQVLLSQVATGKFHYVTVMLFLTLFQFFFYHFSGKTFKCSGRMVSSQGHHEHYWMDWMDWMD